MQFTQWATSGSCLFFQRLHPQQPYLKVASVHVHSVSVVEKVHFPWRQRQDVVGCSPSPWRQMKRQEFWIPVAMEIETPSPISTEMVSEAPHTRFHGRLPQSKSCISLFP